MDLQGWWLIVFLVVFVFAVALALFGRYHGKTGGIGHHSMRGRETSGGEGASAASDRDAFESYAGQRGVR